MGQRLAERLDLLGILALRLAGDRDRLLAELQDEFLDLLAVDAVGLEMLLQVLQILDDGLGLGRLDLLERRFPTFDVLYRGADGEAFKTVLDQRF